MDKIRFFGTTGSKELLYSNTLTPGGIYMEFGNKKFVIDPGPSTFGKFIQTYPGKIGELDAVILSHVHFDHSTDINAILEGMVGIESQKKGMLITSSSAYEGETKVVHEYLKKMLGEICLVDKCPINRVGNIEIYAFEHQHGIDNYGFKMKYGDKIVSLITDTRYFKELETAYAGSTTMIFNVPYDSVPVGKRLKHLCSADVSKMLQSIQPDRVILTHFGESMYETGPEIVAKRLQEDSGIEVLAARENEEYELV
ncbi:MAG: MBL fold metallo-hydrolase [Lachnospiraceae bacterium]|nr:MBL fold metallo-hydrolase [Lachnospiraceae bacterium]